MDAPYTLMVWLRPVWIGTEPMRRESRGAKQKTSTKLKAFLLHLANVKELNKELGNSCDAEAFLRKI